MKIFLSQLPDEVYRLIREFPELEVILKNLDAGESGNILDILNQHGIHLEENDENIATLIQAIAAHNSEIEHLGETSVELRKDVDELTENVEKKADGIQIEGGLVPGTVNFKAGANVHLSVDEMTNTITITSSGTQAADGVPVGTVSYFTATSVPAGWMECDGRILNAVEYPELFAIIGTTFGAGQAGQFKLPDLRGEFIRGWDHGRGVDPSRAFGTHQDDDFKSHDHRIEYNETSQGTGDLAWNFDSGPGFQQVEYQQTTKTGGTETRPKNTALLPFIRVKPITTTLLSAVGVIAGRMDTIEPIVNSNAVYVAGVKSTVQGLDTRLTAAQEAIGLIQTNDVQIGEAVATLQSLIMDMKNDLEEVKDIMASNYTTTEQFNQLSERVGVIELNMISMTNSLESITTQLATISDSVQNAVTMVQSVTSDVTAIQETIDSHTLDLVDHETRIYRLENPPVAPTDPPVDGGETEPGEP